MQDVYERKFCYIFTIFVWQVVLGKFIISVYSYLSIHVSTVVFGNVSDKERLFAVEGGDIHFITVIGGTLVRDDCCVGVAIKCCTYHFRLGSLYTIL